MKNFWLWLAVAIVLVGGYFIFFSKPQETDAVTIGAALGMTGFAQEWGEGELAALQSVLAVHEKTGGKKINIILEDTKSTGAGTVSAVQKLISIDKVDVIFGPTWGDSFQGGFPIVEQAGIPTVTPSSAMETVEDKFEHVFSTWWPQVPEINALIGYMQNKGYSHIALVRDNDAFNAKFTELLGEALPSTMTVVDTTSFSIGTTDFRTVILKLREAKPDAVVLEMQDTSQLGPFMKQAKELGLKSQVISSTSAESQANLDKFPGYFDGLVYTFPDMDESLKLSELRKESVKNTGPSFANAYNAAAILVEAIDKAEDGDITAALSKVSVAGAGIRSVSFDKNRQIKGVVFKVKTVRNNAFQDL